MNSTGAREKKYSSRESQLVSKSFEFLSSDEQDHEPGCSKCSIGIEDKQHGEKVKHFVQMRDGKTARCRKRTVAKEANKQSFRSGIVGLQSLHEDAISENSVSKDDKIPSGHERNYSSRESQFVSETFSFLTMDDDTDNIVTGLVADDVMNRTGSCDVRSPKKHSSRESQFISETFQFLSSGDEDDVFKSAIDCPGGKAALAEVEQSLPAKTYSSRESDVISESFEFLEYGKNKDSSETDSVPVDVSILDKDMCNGFPSHGGDTKSLLRRKSPNGRMRNIESTNSSSCDNIANQTENDIIMLALQRVGEFSEDKFLVHFEDGEERQSVNYDSELQRCHSIEECSSTGTYSDDSDTGTEDNTSVRTSSEVSDGESRKWPDTFISCDH